MLVPSGYAATEGLQEYAVWLVTLLLVAVGFRYAHEVIRFVLDKLYQFFIQNLST